MKDLPISWIESWTWDSEQFGEVRTLLVAEQMLNNDAVLFMAVTFVGKDTFLFALSIAPNLVTDEGLDKAREAAQQGMKQAFKYGWKINL